MTEQARLDPEVRAQLDRLRPFEEVARRIIRLRLDHGLSQEALAERVGTTKSAISRLESGQHAPNLATVERIAAAFGGMLRSPSASLRFNGRPLRSSRSSAPQVGRRALVSVLPRPQRRRPHYVDGLP